MSSRKDFFYRQHVTDAELDSAFDDLENADRDMTASLGFAGVVTNGVVSQHAPNPNLTVDISGPGIVFDQLGRRIFWSPTQTVNLAVDDNGVSTAVQSPANTRWVSIFAVFDRVLSDPRIDGNSQTVFFRHDEGFRFSVAQGAEAASPTPPPLRAEHILLADVRLSSGQTQIVNSNISISRRQDAFVLASGSKAVRRGLIKDALQDVLAEVASLADGLTAAGGAALVGAAASQGLPAGSVRSQLDSLAQSLQQAVRANVANTFTDSQTFNGPASAILPSLKTTATTGTRKLLWEVGSGAFALRFYVSDLLQWEWTINARWTGTLWVPDRTDQDAGKLELTAQSVAHRIVPAGSRASWDDSQWGGGVQFTSNSNAVILLDQNGTITAPGQTENYVGYQGPVGASGSTIAAGCNFKKRYPANPSSFTFAPVATSGVNGVFAAVNVTQVGMGVSTTVNVSTGTASFFARVFVT